MKQFKTVLTIFVLSLILNSSYACGPYVPTSHAYIKYPINTNIEANQRFSISASYQLINHYDKGAVFYMKSADDKVKLIKQQNIEGHYIFLPESALKKGQVYRLVVKADAKYTQKIKRYDTRKFTVIEKTQSPNLKISFSEDSKNTSKTTHKIKFKTNVSNKMVVVKITDKDGKQYKRLHFLRENSFSVYLYRFNANSVNDLSISVVDVSNSNEKLAYIEKKATKTT